MNKGKYKNCDAYIPVHIEKGDIQLAQVSGLYKGMLIQHKGRRYQDAEEI